MRKTIIAGYRSIVLEGDNEVLIKSLKGESHIPQKIQTLIEDTQAYLKYCSNVFIHHIFREGNHIADWLAKFGSFVSCFVFEALILMFLFYLFSLRIISVESLRE